MAGSGRNPTATASRGFDYKKTVVESIDDGIALCLDQLGHRDKISIQNTLGGSVRPQVGEQWMVDRSLGPWTFKARLQAILPVVTDLTGLMAALATLGLITNDYTPGGGGPPTGAAGGDLAGTYPNPTLANTSGARTHLGLGGAALLSVGVITGTVAAGDDSRFTTVNAAVTTAIGVETTRATTAEGVNASAIATETTRATTAEALLAPLASPVLTGNPTVPTQSALTNSTRAASTAYADTAVGVETTRATAAETLKAPLASPTLTGVPTVPTASALTSTTQAASTAYADAAVAVEKARALAAERLRSIATVTSPATVGAVANTDYFVLIGTGGAPTMPTAVGNTNIYTLKNTTTAAVTVATTSAQTIDGTTTISLNPAAAVDLVSDGANWWVV